MMKHLFSLILPLFLVIFSSFSSLLFAQDTADFVILPRAEEAQTERLVDQISTTEDEVWTEINRQNFEWEGLSLGEQLASGSMTWDTIINLISYAISKISQLALFIGALMIIWNGYQYAAHAITWDLPNPDNIKNAIIGICVVIFSYAIMRFLDSAFLV